MTINKAVILAAGEGSRMRPLTFTRPKVMLPIAGKPMLEHLVLAMRESGIREFVLVVGYHEEIIRDYFADGSKWGIKIQYSSQQEQLGTADAVRKVKSLIQDNFLAANGDIILEQEDLVKLLAHEGNAMSGVELDDVSGLGVVEVKDGYVTQIHEKSATPPTHLANAGLYLFTPEIFEAIDKTKKSPRGEYELTDSIQLLINSGTRVAYHNIGRWLDLSYPWHLLNANEKMLPLMQAQVSGEIEPNVVMKGAVSVGKGSLIRSGAYIVGPVMIGENCDIGPNCFIRPCTVIGNNCHIGAGVEIKNSIIMSSSKIPHLSYVGDSVIGEYCNLGAGTKIANLKLNKEQISINGVNTGRRKLGAIIGDHVETGINATINVGSMIGNNTFIGPGALAHGIIKPEARIV